MAENNDTLRLLRLIKHGSREAFDQFYEQHIGFVYHIAFAILKNNYEAEDVCHDIFIDVYQNPDKFDPDKGSIHAWLAVMTKNRCLDQLKKKKPILIEKFEDLITTRAETTESAEANVFAKVERETITEALQRLPLSQRQVLYGTYFKERKHREMAASLNEPLGTIKSRLRYGLKNLKKQKELLHWAKPNGGGKNNEW